VCEHGLAVKPPGGEWEARVNVTGAALARLVQPLLQDFVRRTPGSAIEVKQAGIAWHFRASDPEFATFQANDLLAQLQDVLRRRPYGVLRGNRVIEVRHQNVTKGQAVLHILSEYPDTDLVFCAGDDRTDEEMMEAIVGAWRKKSITCWVGGRNAQAAYWVESNVALLAQLELLIRAWKSRESGIRPRGKEPPRASATKR
jgi:trehalose-phosphatase